MAVGEELSYRAYPTGTISQGKPNRHERTVKSREWESNEVSGGKVKTASAICEGRQFAKENNLRNCELFSIQTGFYAVKWDSWF